MQILLLEPNRLLAKNLRRALMRAGHQVKHMVEPQAAVLAIDKKLPDLVIMELLLAGHSGVEFLYELRSYPEWQQLPVIVYSSLPLAEAQGYANNLATLNIKSFFYKPEASLAQLLAAVEQLAPVA